MKKLVSKAVLNDKGKTIGYKQELIDMTQAEIDQRNIEVAKFKAEQLATEYIRNRVAAYPPMGDQLDALWKGGAEATTMKNIIDNIKIKYPKP